MKKKIILLAIIILSFLIVFLGGLFWWTISGVAPNREGGAVKVFIVQKGEGVSSIGDRLKEQGLIKSALRFKIYLYFNQKIANTIQAGSFTLTPSLSIAKIAQSLTKGTNDQWVTIVEGLRQEEIGQQLIKASFPFQFTDWLKAIDQQNLEGQLFPDTYLIPINASLDKILSVFSKNFQKKVVVGLDNAITGSLKFSQNDFLTLASLVEREARSDTSRPIVAGIIIKRLEADWPLQVDASVQYAIASRDCLSLIANRQSSVSNCVWWKKSLTKTDLAVKSPYNTYLNRGLPPSPICNPSLSAIKAVLNPTKTDYWFYLTGNDNLMHYGKTIEEHNMNIQKYL